MGGPIQSDQGVPSELSLERCRGRESRASPKWLAIITFPRPTPDPPPPLISNINFLPVNKAIINVKTFMDMPYKHCLIVLSIFFSVLQQCIVTLTMGRGAISLKILKMILIGQSTKVPHPAGGLGLVQICLEKVSKISFFIFDCIR